MKLFLVVIGILIWTTAVSAEPRLRNQNHDRLQESVAKFTMIGKRAVDVRNEREMKRQEFQNTIQKLTAPDAFRAVRPVVEVLNPNRRNLGK